MSLQAQFAHACKLGLEGIVSKRKARPIAPAVRPINSR
jgi:ATP-dependent DNA ligase